MRLIIIVAAVMSGFVFISLLFFRATRKTYPGFDRWTVGVGFLTVGYLAFALRGVIPDPLSILSGNVAFPLGIVFMLDGLRRFLGLTPMSGFWYALPAMNLAGVAVLYYLYDSAFWRSVLTAIAISVPHWPMAAYVFRHSVKRKSIFYPVIGSLLGLAGLVVLARAAAAFFLPQWHLLMDSPFQLGSFVALIVLQIGESLSLMMLNSERVESELVEAEAELRRTVDRLQQSLTDRERVEEALRENEEKYRNFFNTSRDCVFMTTVDGWFVEVNDVALDVFGYAPAEKQELLQRNVASFYANPEEREAHAALVSRMGFSKEYPVDLRRKDGTIIHALITTVARKDSHGNVIGFQGTVRDITERTRAEETLRTTLQRFYAILSSLYAGVLIVTEEGSVEFVNPAFCNLFDLPDRPDNLHGLMSPEMIARIKDAYAEPANAVARIREIVAKNLPIKGEEIAIRGGRTYMVDYIPILVDGKSSGRLWHHSDITDRKKAEDALLESEETFRSVFEHSPDGIILGAPDGTAFKANPAACRMLGRSKEEIREVGRDGILDLTDPRLAEALEERTRTGYFRGEVNCRRKDGSTFPVEGTSVVFRNAQGELRTCLIFQDITEKKRYETEKENLQRQLIQAQKMEAIGTLTGGIAHDFNNLLTIINGYADMILMEKTEDDPIYADLQKILQTGRKGADMVQRLLAFSKRAEISLQTLNLNRVVENSVNLIEATFPKMIEIQTILANDLDMVNADAAQVEQVVMNLCINAKEAMPGGGRLGIETRNITVDEDYCRLNPGAKLGRYVLVEVSDTGTGMTKETMDRMFDPFFTTKGWDFRKGTGLGLSVARGIVDQHGGWIMCHSEPGNGSTLAVYFPTIKDSAVVRNPEPMEKSVPGTATILLVDDEEYVLDLGKRILERSGYTVITAANGEAALEIYAKERSNIALVILDLVMPQMGGEKCLEELLNINPHVKVIVSSGHSLSAQERDYLGGFVQGFVNKPYDVGQLVQTVKRVLDAGGPAQ